MPANSTCNSLMTEKSTETNTHEIQKLNHYVKTIMDGAFSYALLLDGEGKILRFSSNLLLLSGIDDGSSFVGIPVLEACKLFNKSNFVEDATRRLTRIMSGENDFFEDDTIVWPSGEKRFYRINYRRSTDDNGNCEAILIFAHDITDLRHEEANRRIDELLNSTTLPCFIWNKKGDIIAFNSKASDIFKTPHDLSPESFNEFIRAIQPEYQPDGNKTEVLRLKVIEDALRDGFAHVTVWLVNADMTPLYFEVNVTCISWLFEQRFVVYLNDFSEIIKKDAEARKAEELIKIMFNATPLCCTILDKDCNFIDCNEETVKIFDLPDKQVYLNDFYRFSPERQPDGELSSTKCVRYVKEAFEKGHLVFEWMHQNYHGEPIPAEVTLVLIKRSNQSNETCDNVTAYVRDLREVKANEKKMLEIKERERRLEIQREAAHAANAAKSQFIANMSHEIRTPMNSIVGFSELAMDENISSKAREYLDKISENASGLLQIINDLLDISKIESGRMEFENIPFDLEDVFSYCKMAVEPKAIENGVSLSLSAEPFYGKKLVGDPTRLRQVLLNLLSNAVKFTNVGTVKLTSVIKKVSGSGVIIGFEVSDTGIGITQEQINRIYEPFMQADSSMTRKYGGTGLGLSITENILQLMGSRLDVESTPNVGSVFSFKIAFDTIDNNSEKLNQGKDEQSISKPMFAGEILVCEDNRMNQMVISEHLNRIGIKVEIAENGAEGVKHVKNRIDHGIKPYDLIFMDIHMPVMDGLEAVSLIKQIDTHTPIIAMTADIKTHDKMFYQKTGMNGCVGKPFTSQELWRCLLNYLKPVSFDDTKQDYEKLMAQLRVDFVNSNQSKYDEIVEAISSGDFKTAYRLSHTLKSTAGLIGQNSLQRAAANIENLLRNEENIVTEDYLDVLKTELDSVLHELSPLLKPAEPPPVDSVKAIDAASIRKIIKDMEPLLISGNSECLNFIEILQSVPDSRKLIDQIEDFDFEPAIKTLAHLKEKWG